MYYDPAFSDEVITANFNGMSASLCIRLKSKSSHKIIHSSECLLTRN